MKITLTQTIELKNRHKRILQLLAHTRIGWDRGVTGRVLDDLESWRLVECDYGYGAELYHLTNKGKEALKQLSEK